MKNCVVMLLAISCVLGFMPGTSLAQEFEDGYNSNSVNPIHESHQLYKVRVWRRIDLREKMNKPFFSANREITKFFIESVKNGTLNPYTNDSLTQRMTKEQFMENLKIPGMGGGGADDMFGGSGGGGFGDTGGGFGEEEEEEESATAQAYYFAPKDASVLEIKEDVIFDKHRGRVYYKIQSVKMILPPENFPETGLLKEVATFRYKDLHRLFMENPDKAIWVNNYNDAEHRNLAEAFELRLFDGRIVKYSNPDNEYIIDMEDGDPRSALLRSMEYEYELLEKEHMLWEY